MWLQVQVKETVTGKVEVNLIKTFYWSKTIQCFSRLFQIVLAS